MTDSKLPEVLITGAGGATAKYLIQLLAKNHSLVLVDFRRCIPEDSNIPSYCLEYGKRGFEDIFRRHNITAVIHLGRMAETELTQPNRYNCNVLGTKRLLDLCCKYAVKQVVVLSTYYVYGASPYNPALICEDQPLKASQLTMDLVDSVELANLATIYLWKYKELNITILRPCNIAGPGIMNSMSMLLKGKFAPVQVGFSPIMQFIHIHDMANAIKLAVEKNVPGIYNVATDEYVSYQHALRRCGTVRVFTPHLLGCLPKNIRKLVGVTMWPSYLANYYKYPVVIDGSLFNETFGFLPSKSLSDIFSYYHLERK